MIYELSSLRRVIRDGGLKPLPQYIFLYFQHLAWGLRLFFRRRTPQGVTPESALAFTFGPSGKLIVPGQFQSEIRQLAELAYQKKPRVVVEIGTKWGGTLAIWCAIAQPDATLVSIDLPGGIHGGGYARWRALVYRRLAQAGQSLHLLRLDSHRTETREHLKTLLPPGGIDLLFIDGDHTYDGVKMDFEMYSPLVRRGGLVVFHDICVHSPHKECQVDKFWEEIRTQHKSWEYVENPVQTMFGIGVLEL
jgi:predicted O-methyltransferase YrrM